MTKQNTLSLTDFYFPWGFWSVQHSPTSFIYTTLHEEISLTA